MEAPLPTAGDNVAAPAGPRPPSPEHSARIRLRALVALGFGRAWEGILPKISVAFGALLTLVMLSIAIAAARRDVDLQNVATATARVLGWGAGVLAAFAAAARALDRDRDDGYFALLESRGAHLGAYLWARIGGLALLLLVVVAGGTLVTGLGATMAARSGTSALAALHGTAVGVVYAAAFSVTVAPLSMAALGARSRAGGYGVLFLVLILPELLASISGGLVPEPWTDVVSIPSALDSLREGLSTPLDPARCARAVFALAIVVALATLVVRSQAAIRRKPA